MMALSVAHYLFLLLLPIVMMLHVSSQPESISDLDTDRDSVHADYTIRYLSLDGSDTEDCLKNQTYPPPSSGNRYEACGSLRYAVTGSQAFRSFNVSNVMVLIWPGEYGYGNVTMYMTNFTNIVVSKMPGSKGEVVLHCDDHLSSDYNNIYFTYSSYILLKELVFTGCGSLSPGMAATRVDHICIEGCIFRENSNSGLNLYQTTDAVVIDSIFQDNNSTGVYNYTVYPGDLRFAGGIYISLDDQKAYIKLQNCTFARNHALLSAINSKESRPSLYVTRGHGGAVLVLFNRSVDSMVIIEDSDIRDNTALYNAGGLYFAFANNSSNNIVQLKNVKVHNNTCGGLGGGVLMVAFESSDRNLLVAENVTFTDNVAEVGGGGCAIQVQDILIEESDVQIKNTASFSSCSFSRNSSPRGGSAISLLSNARVDRTLATVNLTNCNITNNTGDRALLSVRFPIQLEGSNVISDNIEGGVSLLNARMDVEGSVQFQGNFAVEGGAIAINDEGLIQLFSGANLTFIGNQARTSGGAISVNSPTVNVDTNFLMNTHCFVQYKANDPMATQYPSKWNVSLRFINNTAEQDGAAIYASDISRCTFIPSYNSTNTDENNEREKSIFNLSPQFFYRGNHIPSPRERINETIGTAPSVISVSPMNISAAPGEKIDFNISANDQSGNLKQAVWTLDVMEGDQNINDDGNEEIFVLPAGNLYTHTIKVLDETQYRNHCMGISQSLKFSLVDVSVGAVANTSNVGADITCCHVGYTFSEDKCTVLKTSPLLRSDNRNRYVYVEDEIYAETMDNGLLATAPMPVPYQRCSRQGSLPGCLFKYDKPEEQCAGGRSAHGAQKLQTCALHPDTWDLEAGYHCTVVACFLCGRCQNGTNVDLTLTRCIECSIRDAVLFAILVIVLMIICILVLVFNIGIPNDLKACVFFIQVVGFVYHSSRDNDRWDLHISRLFGFTFYFPLCPYPGYDALYTVNYGFLVIIIGVVSIVGYVISARFIRILSQRSSFDGIWLITDFVYIYTADTCLNILRCEKVTLIDQEGNTSVGKYKFFYDGSIECFQPPHLGSAIFAILFGGIFIVIFPIVICVISFRHFKHTQPFTDVLSMGYKPSRRWWSGYDLIRRLLFIMVSFLFDYIEPSFTQLALLGAGLIIFFVAVWAQPYQAKRTNIIEAVVLMDLLLITGIFLNMEERSTMATQGFGIILLFLPFLAILFYIVAKIISYWWKRWSPTTFTSLFSRVKDSRDMKKPDQRRKQHRAGMGRLVQMESIAGVDFDSSWSSESSQANYSQFRDPIMEQLDT